MRKQTFKFLKDVAENNDREWFAAHKHEYEAAREDALELVSKLIPRLAEIDPLISLETDPKRSLMRIYRDVRFSKNKDPYKTNFGIWFSASSKGGDEPGYYLHLQPGNCFVAGGYWMPLPDHLKSIRQEIDYNSSEFLSIINHKDFAAELELSKENTLKKAPKGYDPDDANIEYLKLKSFEIVKQLPDSAFYDAGIVDQVSHLYKLIYPLVSFLRNAISN